MRGFIFGLSSVSLVYLSPSHNLSIIGVLQKVFVSNRRTPVLFFKREVVEVQVGAARETLEHDVDLFDVRTVGGGREHPLEMPA